MHYHNFARLKSLNKIRNFFPTKFCDDFRKIWNTVLCKEYKIFPSTSDHYIRGLYSRWRDVAADARDDHLSGRVSIIRNSA